MDSSSMVQSSFDMDFNGEVVGLHARFTSGFELLKTKQYWWSYRHLKYPIQCIFVHIEFKEFCEYLTELVDSQVLLSIHGCGKTERWI